MYVCMYKQDFTFNNQLGLIYHQTNLIINSSAVTAKTKVKILDKTDCISHSTCTLGKGMNPIILPPAMGK